MSDHSPELISPKKLLSDPKVILLYLLVLTFPLDIWAVLVVGGRGIRLFWILGLLLILVFSVCAVLGRQKIRMTQTGRAILIFNVIALLSSVNLLNASTSQRVDFATEWLQLILYTLLFFVITSLKLSAEHLRILFGLWIGVAVVLSLYGIYQIFARSFGLPLGYLPIANPSIIGATLTKSGPPIGAFFRVSSIFIEPGFFASYLLSPLLFTGILWVLRKEDISLFTRNHKVLLSVLMTLYIAFLFAFSMAAYVALACVGVAVFFNKELRARFLRTAFVAVLVLIVLGFALKPVFKDNFLTAVFERIKAHVVSLSDPLETYESASPYARTSLKNRVKRAREGLKVWSGHPVIGVGLNNFSGYFPDDVEGLIHSGFVQILAELGLLGLLGFGMVYGSALLLIRKSWSRMRYLPGYALIVAFYYILCVRVFHFVITENWIRGTIWLDLTLAVLLFQWLNDKAIKNGNRTLVLSDEEPADHDRNLTRDM